MPGNNSYQVWSEADAVFIDESEAAEIQRLWVEALPIVDGLGRLAGIALQPPVIGGAPRLDVVRGDARRKRKAVPAPVRHRIAADGLKAGAICIEGEVAVAQWNLSVERRPIDIVPGNESVAVNGWLRGGGRCHCANEEEGDERTHERLFSSTGGHDFAR